MTQSELQNMMRGIGSAYPHLTVLLTEKRSSLSLSISVGSIVYSKNDECRHDALKLDTRYREDVQNPLKDLAPQFEEDDTLVTPDLFTKYIGDKHGIQGHHNSCYLDATVFGFFALSDLFDMILLLEEPNDHVGQKIKHILWKGIVNPLRKYGLVRYESVMELCNSLEEFRRIKGPNRDEKDPEEFLNLLFKEVLHVKPFLSIKRPFGVEKEYFIQLFYEIDPQQNELPETEKLITQMFHEQNISFTNVPSKLLLQMPRFGKDFKMYNRTIPSLTINVKPLLDPSARGTQTCFSCLSSTVTTICYNCPKYLYHIDEPYVFYCSNCCENAHKNRKDHHCEDVELKQDNIGDVSQMSQLILLSVICIETSHYVCYTRSQNRWLFHDSMANRLYDMHYIPKVVDVTQDIQDWVYNPDNRQKLKYSPAKSIPEYVRCYTQDIYMCIYVNPGCDLFGEATDPIGQHFDAITYGQHFSSEYKVSDLNISQVPVDENEKRGACTKMSNLKDEYHQLQQTYQQKQDEFFKLQTQLSQLQKIHQDIVEEHHHLKETFFQLQDVNRQQLEDHYHLQVTHQNQQAEYSHLKEEHSQLQTGHHELQETLKQLRKENDFLQKTINAIEDNWKVSFKELAFTKEELGRGGWGVIWVGIFREQRVAVKQMYQVIRSHDNLKLLHREINTMAQLRHPNLLQFIGAVLDDPSGNPMIITEIMDTSLRGAYETKLLNPDPSYESVLLTIMRDVAVGLNYLHCLPDPIIHRDVSSANVLLESKGPHKWKTKISDFGSANKARYAVTQARGALVYSAPESLTSIVRVQKVQTTKIDVFSYGVLFCEVMTCRFPDPSVFQDMLQEVSSRSLPLHYLVLSCIKEDPSRRPIMKQVIERLDSYIKQCPK